MATYQKMTRAVLMLVAAITLLTSCATRKEIVYFQNTRDFETLVNRNQFSPKFKIDDIISIYVSTLDAEASVPFNLFRGAQEGGGPAGTSGLHRGPSWRD